MDLGCGKKKLTKEKARIIFKLGSRIEIVGLDKYPLDDVDVIHDAEYPLPFKSNSFDFVYASHSLEHVQNVIQLINEVHRILKPNGIFKVIVPHFGNRLAFVDLQHCNFFSLHSFDQFDPTQPFGSVKYTTNITFKKLRRKIVFGKELFGIEPLNIGDVIKYFILKLWGIVVNRIPEFWEETILCRFFPCSIEFELGVVK